MKFFKFILADLQSKTPYLQKDLQNAGIDESQFNDYIQTANNADPTGDKAVYTQWILRQYLQNTIINADEYKEVLNNFTKLKNSKKIQPADLNQYKTFDDLKNKVEQTMEDLGGDTSTRSKEKRLTEEGIQLLDRDGNIELYLVTTPEATAKEFRNTGWCVKDPEWFKNYAETDPNFYYFKKDGKPFILAHKEGVTQTNNNGKQFVPPVKSLLEIYPLVEKYNLIKINSSLNISLVDAIEEGYTNIVKSLLENGADVNAKGGIYGATALMYASARGYTDTVKLLLEKGADVKEYGNTALIVASARGYTNIVKLLLEYGADPNIPKTALDYAKDPEIKQLLEKYSKNKTSKEASMNKMEKQAYGYYGYSKSNNAVGAENAGRYPLAQASKILAQNLGITQQQAKWLLEEIGTNEWHHTSSWYNRTKYYDTDIDEIINNLSVAEVQTKEDLKRYVENNFKPVQKTQPEKTGYQADFDYIVWTGTRNYPKANKYHLENVYVVEKGSFYYVYDKKDGNLIVKKKIGSNGTKARKKVTSMKQEIKKQANLIDVKITFDNGDIIETNVNGDRTDEQIKEYYKVGKTFNLGNGEKDNLAKVVKVEIDRGMNKQAAPTMPKPTTVLPDNMTWAWSEELKQWIAINKDNTYAVADKNVAATNTYSATTDTVNQAVNYTTAGMVEVLASLMDKKEIKRSEIDDNYFTPLMANELIALSGVNFDGTTKFHVTRAGLLFAKKASEIQVKKEIFG